VSIGLITTGCPKELAVSKIMKWLGTAGLVLITAVVCVPVILIEWYAVAVWWDNRVPRRPKGVPDDAVFLDLGGPKVPISKGGDWLNCWPEPQEDRDRCRLTRADGTVLYEGDFIPYQGGGSVPASQLRIEPVRTQGDSLWVGFAFVPLIHLTNGKILIPIDYYEEAAKLIEERKKLRR
jgi:hypothetical protein